MWAVAELYAADFPAPRFVVADLVPAGLTILAGRPKLGKSWLALQTAAAVGTGGSVLGLNAECGPMSFWRWVCPGLCGAPGIRSSVDGASDTVT